MATVAQNEDRISLRLTDRPLSLDDCMRFVATPEAGAIASFCGTTRNHHDGFAAPAAALPAVAHARAPLRAAWRRGGAHCE